MAKGENIFKRKDGRWEARYIKGHDLAGRIQYGFCYGKTYREAKEKVTKLKAALVLGKTPPPVSCHRLSFYCDEWLRLKQPRVRESTYVKYAATVEKHIKPKLGGCFPAAIRTELLDSFVHELLYEDGLAVKSVHDILVILRSVLNHAAEQLPGAFPPVEIHYPKGTKKEMRVLSRREQERLVQFLLTDLDDCKFGLLLALFTGIRIGELCALHWGDISVEEQTVCVRSTLQRLRYTSEAGTTRTRILIGDPKSVTSARTIPLTADIVALCRKMKVKNDEAYVLTGTTAFMEPRTLQYRIKKYTRACQLEGVHCHTLRHTFATRAVEVGFEIKSLSEVLGHATTTITLERYVHSSMELKRSNMSKLATAGLSL